jgi:DNA gyrase inhibitor GyrI
LYEFLDKKAVDKRAIQAFYSIALDDPNIVERKKCRFDACVQVLAKITPEGEIGEKQLSGGLFACFDYYGPSSGIEGAFDEIYRSWYSTSTITLSDKESICEHIGSFEEEHEEKKRHTKIYIPVTRKK